MTERRRGCGAGCLRTLAAVLLAIVIMAACVGGVWFWYKRGNPASGLLTNLTGVVQTRPESQEQWQAATNNQTVSGGDHVSTGASSSATIVFFDVSTVDLGADTEVSIMEAYTTRRGTGGNLSIGNLGGRTSVRMVRFTDPTSEFSVETPTASTTIRGAQMDVNVGPDGATEVTVDQGSAVVTGNGSGGAAVPGGEVGKVTDGLMRFAVVPNQQGQAFTLTMGQQANVNQGGTVSVTQLYEPSPDALLMALEQAFNTPGTTFSLTITERMVNEYILSVETGFDQAGVVSPTVWFSDGTIIIGGEFSDAGLLLPVSGPFTIVLRPSVNNGALQMSVEAVNVAGVPLPSNLLTQVVRIIESTFQEVLTDPALPIQFTSVQVGEGSLTLEGTKGSS